MVLDQHYLSEVIFKVEISMKDKKLHYIAQTLAVLESFVWAQEKDSDSDI